MSAPTRVPGVVAAALALWGCGAGAGEPDGDASFSGAEWTATEDLRIGSVDDPVYALTAVTDAAVGPDGSVYTLHGQEHLIRRWSGDGTHRADIGGEGQGPGEFESPRMLGFFGDTLWVFESNHRLTLFDPEGSLRGTVTPEVDLGTPEMDRGALPSRPEGPLRDGTWWGNMPAFSDAVAAGDVTRVPYVRMRREGTVTDTVWVRPIPERGRRLTLAVEWGTGGSYSRQPLADTPLPLVDPVRMALYVVERRAAPSGASRGEWSVLRLDMAGDTTWRRAVTYEPSPVPAAVTDSLLDVMKERFSILPERTELTVARVSEIVEQSLYTPAHYTPVETALVGRDGTFWVGLRAPDGATTREWRVFSEDGSDLARVSLPADLRVHTADRTHVWGNVTGELDVPYLVRLRIDG